MNESQDQEVKTTIDIAEGVMIVKINLGKGKVTCYGTLQLAQEMGSRYFLTKEIQVAKAAREEDHGKVKVILPAGVKL